VRKILVTGSEGLVGAALSAELRARGLAVVGLDPKLPAGHPGRADIADGGRIEELADGCCGIVHLAAVSRVVWAEPRQPRRQQQRFRPLGLQRDHGDGITLQ